MDEPLIETSSLRPGNSPGHPPVANGKAKTGRKAKPAARPARGFPFKLENGRLWRQIKTDREDGSVRRKWISFCSEIHVIALTRNEEGEDWGRLLEIVDRDQNRHLWAMPLSLTAGSGEALRAELLRLGLELEPNRAAKNWLQEYLTWAEPEQRARCVSHIGWHGDTYVLPDRSFGTAQSSETVILQSSERLDHAFNTGGTLEDWRETIAKPAIGNSRLITCLSAAFAAPLLAIAGEEGGGLHIRGASSSGKSTALILAGSVWGGGGTRGFVRQWRATDNALESIAALSCDNLLCLDELSQVDAKAAGAAAYMLANGKGKARAGREGQARRVREWRVLFLSSGEIALSDKIREGGGRIAAGMEVRVIDLRADAGADIGIFEKLYGTSDPATFSQNLKLAANSSFGHAGRMFLEQLVKDIPGHRTKIAEMRRFFISRYLPEGADGQVRRVADRFAMLAAAGCIAAKMGITGWPSTAARDAALRCFNDWLQERGGIGASEETEARRRITHCIESYGPSRFQKWENTGERQHIPIRYGFVKSEETADPDSPNRSYYFLPEPLRDLLKGLDFRSVIAALMKAGVIHPQHSKPNKVFHVPADGGKHRLYQINADPKGG